MAIAIAASAIALPLVAACGSSSSGGSPAATSSSTTAAQTAYPVTVQNCGNPVTVSAEPSRAVSNDVNTTEDMLALGLAPRMVGDFGVDSSANAGMPSEYKTAFASVKHVSPNYFTLEPLVGLKPDFLFAGWYYGLDPTSHTLTPDNLKKFGITTLALTESCSRVATEQSISIDATYQDLENLGKIFNVQDKADALIASMKATVATVQQKVAGQKPVSVFLYDSGNSSPFTAPGLAMPNALISLAGGTNIFASLKQSWTSVSWEKVVAAQPQCILINDYDTPTWQQKEHFLKTFKLTKDLPAVKNNCIFHLRYDQLTPSPQNAASVEAIAKWLHPTAFGLPANS
ncbi:MAG TPA: ABC transporter substrate-binding protein [Mycobacteriales bacterium]|nr:ABC transporter substrate-binding protein [Mycobacteriales bacterium]